MNKTRSLPVEKQACTRLVAAWSPLSLCHRPTTPEQTYSTLYKGKVKREYNIIFLHKGIKERRKKDKVVGGMAWHGQSILAKCNGSVVFFV